jgi:hypothetical protein
MMGQEKPLPDETEQQQQDRKQMAEIFSEALVGDIIERQMRERERKQQEMQLQE